MRAREVFRAGAAGPERCWWVLAVAILPGCWATTTSYLAFEGAQVPPERTIRAALSQERVAGIERAEPPTPAGSSLSSGGVSAKGWVTTTADHKAALSLEIANHGANPIRLSYVTDEYLGKTRDQRTILFEKGDFLDYPDWLGPGDVRSVTLLLPDEVPAYALGEIIARLNMGQTVLSVRPMDARVALDGGAPAPLIAPPEGSPTAPLMPGPRPYVFPALRRIDVPVRVVVEFQQELGTALKAHVRWNDAGDAVTLSPEGSQTFYVAPGRHVLRVSSVLPSIAATRGSVPVEVRPGDESLRIIVTARAKLTGVELHVRVRNGLRTLSDHVITPSGRS